MIFIQRISPIIIAEIQGLATAAGCQLACTCDLAIASSKSKFEMPGVKIGLFPLTPAIPLSRLVGTKRSMQMLVTAEPINANKALDWGIINQIVEIENLNLEDTRIKLREASLNLAEKVSKFSFDTLTS